MRLATSCMLALIACVALAAFAEDSLPGGDSATRPADDSAPAVELDQLLRLPNSYEADVERRGGATARQWRERFAGARGDLAEAQRRLVEIEKELKQVSQTTSGWAVAAPGSSDPQASPLSLRLRQDVRDQRARIEEVERRLRSLEVEADLAGVPPEWRQ